MQGTAARRGVATDAAGSVEFRVHCVTGDSAVVRAPAACVDVEGENRRIGGGDRAVLETMRSGQRSDEELCPNCRLPMVRSPRHCRHCGIPSSGSSTEIVAGSDDGDGEGSLELDRVAQRSGRLVVPIGYWLLQGPIALCLAMVIASAAWHCLFDFRRVVFECRMGGPWFVPVFGALLCGCALMLRSYGRILWNVTASCMRARQEQAERRRSLAARRAAGESATCRSSLPD
jgi:hypothetical protein